MRLRSSTTNSIIYYIIVIINLLLFIIYYLLFIIYHLSSIIYYLSFIIIIVVVIVYAQFIAHPHVQQLLSKIWYDGLPGFRSKSLLSKTWDVLFVAFLYPVYCVSYILLPNSELGRRIKKPIVKFLIHVTSYLFFLGEYDCATSSFWRACQQHTYTLQYLLPNYPYPIPMTFTLTRALVY